MKRLTYNEIIKALQCCSIKRGGCKKCPLWHRDGSCIADLAKLALSLVNRQQTEIEQLKKVSTEADNFARTICNERMLKGKSVTDFEDLQEYITKQKSKAIKEFADILAVKYKTTHYLPNDDDMIMVAKSDMDILVNEMLGENNV